MVLGMATLHVVIKISDFVLYQIYIYIFYYIFRENLKEKWHITYVLPCDSRLR